MAPSSLNQNPLLSPLPRHYSVSSYHQPRLSNVQWKDFLDKCIVSHSTNRTKRVLRTLRAWGIGSVKTLSILTNQSLPSVHEAATWLKKYGYIADVGRIEEAENFTGSHSHYFVAGCQVVPNMPFALHFKKPIVFPPDHTQSEKGCVKSSSGWQINLNFADGISAPGKYIEL